MSVLTVDQALAEILPAFRPNPTIRVPLAEALGLHLASDLAAGSDLPPFDNSAMDGWAVRAADLAGASAAAPVALPVRGESRAGGPPPPALAPGSAMRIFTGAPLPEGADAVVMQEDTTREGDVVRIAIAPRTGAHVRTRGGDLRAGATMLARGARLGPGEIGLLAAQDQAAVEVHRRPRVALLSTGDELRDVGEPARPGSIVNSNAHALAAQVRDAGGEPWVLPNVPDRHEATVAAVREGLTADVLVSCGGVSVGEYDLVHAAMASAGVERRLWKVAIKPGKPLAFGVAPTGVPVVGLPGNPVSAMVTFEVFVRPGLRRMLGDPAPFRAVVPVVLEAPHRHSTGRLELARAILRQEGDRTVARLHPLQGSGSLPSMVGVDALVLLPGDREHFAAGEVLRALVTTSSAGAERSPFDQAPR